MCARNGEDHRTVLRISDRADGRLECFVLRALLWKDHVLDGAACTSTSRGEFGSCLWDGVRVKVVLGFGINRINLTQCRVTFRRSSPAINVVVDMRSDYLSAEKKGDQTYWLDYSAVNFMPFYTVKSAMSIHFSRILYLDNSVMR